MQEETHAVRPVRIRYRSQHATLKALLVQLDRTPAYGADGWGFKSLEGRWLVDEMSIVPPSWTKANWYAARLWSLCKRVRDPSSTPLGRSAKHTHGGRRAQEEHRHLRSRASDTTSTGQNGRQKDKSTMWIVIIAPAVAALLVRGMLKRRNANLPEMTREEALIALDNQTRRANTSRDLYKSYTSSRF